MRDSVVLVTGGCGFIGTRLIQIILQCPTATVFNFDKLTYAADHEFHRRLEGDEARYNLVEIDIADSSKVRDLVHSVKPDFVFNLAAESHVDRSIDSAAPFVATNLLGTHVMLDACLDYWRSLTKSKQETFRFVQVSTDEVYGDFSHPDAADSHSALAPSSPYAATKAGADLLGGAYYRTHGLPVLVTRSSNNYGPRQHPEKLIPVAIATALSGLAIPVYGDGSQVRDWIHVDDNARGLLSAAKKGLPGQVYCLAGGNSYSNLDVVKDVCHILDALAPRPDGSPHFSAVELVRDRPGHDVRYALDDAESRSQLEWQPRTDFSSGLHATVQWFVENQEWWGSASGFSYQRLGHGN